MNKEEKALVYCVYNHASTEIRQPVVIDDRFIRFGDFRVGNYLYNAIGKRVFTIRLHSPWPILEKRQILCLRINIMDP